MSLLNCRLHLRSPDEHKRLIETRLMIHTPDGWKGAAYVWNDDYSDARLKKVGAVVPIEWIHFDGSRRETTYFVPNMNDCRMCHQATGTMGPIGLKARQLNRSIESPSGAINQLAHWSEKNILKGLPEVERISGMAAWSDDSQSLDDRAAAYLDINCAHCHNLNGLARSSTVILSFLDSDAFYNGKAPAKAEIDFRARGRYTAVSPGVPDHSQLLNRMRSLSFTGRMPRIGRTVPHDEGIALMREWILSLEPINRESLHKP